MITMSCEPAVTVFDDGKVHVRAEQCDHCLFSADRLVPGARARQLIADSRAATGGSFVCHRGQVSDEHQAICRVWWDRYSQDDWVLRLAVGLDIIELVGL